MGFVLPAELATRLRAARSIGVITGAGISAESGIPTYRGKGGIYDDPEQGDRTIEALSAPTLRTDPDRAWQAIAKIAGAASGAQPNAAHHALVEIERKVERFVLLTQNVDGFHAAAGTRNLIDIHGDTFKLLCMKCGRRGDLSREPDIEPCIQTIVATGKAPRCECGGTIRPDVVFFGEMLPEAKVQRLHDEFYHRVPDVVISVGTSNMFPYIVQPVLIAAQQGRLTVEINPEETEISGYVAYHLKAKAGEALTAIAAAL